MDVRALRSLFGRQLVDRLRRLPINNNRLILKCQWFRKRLVQRSLLQNFWAPRTARHLPIIGNLHLRADRRRCKRLGLGPN